MDNESKNGVDKVEDEIMLPGFRFHPTDEELVGFYLKNKILHKSLPIELIKQLDIYKYEPWDLPKLAASGEKEWYFYCPRDRKYRNSARPNRVTRAGFWKATGTDRPIYSSDATECIGLKKSLVFYQGRAAKGCKTDWMMHEFRLPSTSDKTLSANDSWAICRIFRKINSMAQRAFSHTLIPSTHHFGPCNLFNSENISCVNNELQHAQKWRPSPLPVSNGDDHHNSLTFSQCTVDASSKVLSPEMTKTIPDDNTKDSVSESMDFQVRQQQYNGFSINLPQDMQGTSKNWNEALEDSSHLGTIRSMGFPFSLSPNFVDAWKPSLPWDSLQCPSETSTTYSTDKCYT